MVVTLSGDVISHADINLKLPRPAVGKDLYSNTSIREDAPWQLQQVQDSVNHLSQALALIRNSKSDYGSSTELCNFLDRLMASLTRSRNSLVNPKKKTLDELRNSRQVVSKMKQDWKGFQSLRLRQKLFLNHFKK